MAQHLSYNGMAFDDDAVWFTIHRRPVISRVGRRSFVEHRWNLTGRCSGANTGAVQAKMATIESNMVDGGDLTFSLYHSLSSASCVEGTHVYDFKWLPGFDGVRGSGAELVLRRTFSAVIGGRVLATSDTDLIEYRESVRGVGSTGPIVLPVGSLAGDVQAQETQLKTHWTGYQTGYAIGLTTTPPASTPIFLATPGVYYYPLQTSEELDTPINWAINQSTAWKISWRYVCWSKNVLLTSPISPF